MKNKIILPIAIFSVSLFIIPQITFASWWNPYAWNIWEIFKSKVNIEQMIISTSTSDNQIAQRTTNTNESETQGRETKVAPNSTLIASNTIGVALSVLARIV